MSNEHTPTELPASFGVDSNRHIASLLQRVIDNLHAVFAATKTEASDATVKQAALDMFKLPPGGLGFEPVPGNGNNRNKNLEYIRECCHKLRVRAEKAELIEGSLRGAADSLDSVRELLKKVEGAVAEAPPEDELRGAPPAGNDARWINLREEAAKAERTALVELVKKSNKGEKRHEAAAMQIPPMWSAMTGMTATTPEPDGSVAYYKSYLETHLNVWIKPKIDARAIFDGSLGSSGDRLPVATFFAFAAVIRAQLT